MKKLFSILAGLMLSLNILAQTTIGASGISGTGIPTTIAKFIGPKKLSSSIIYESSNNIGIGYPSPIVKLQVDGNIFATGSRLGSISVGSYSFWGNPDNEITSLFDGTGKHLIFQNTGGGNIGIGTSTPTAKLTVNGSVRYTALPTVKPSNVGDLWDSLGYIKRVR